MHIASVIATKDVEASIKMQLCACSRLMLLVASRLLWLLHNSLRHCVQAQFMFYCIQRLVKIATWLCANAAGTTVKVTTVDGLVDLKIPGGTQPGTTLVMSKRGVPRLGASNSRGDHQVLYICSPLCIAQNKLGFNAVIQMFKYQYGTEVSWGSFTREMVL